MSTVSHKELAKKLEESEARTLNLLNQKDLELQALKRRVEVRVCDSCSENGAVLFEKWLQMIRIGQFQCLQIWEVGW